MTTQLFKSVLFFLILISSGINAQIESLSLGGNLHLGNIAGNSTPITSIGGSLFFDFFPWFEHDVSFRVSASYSQMVEKFLPENRTGKYYPFIKTISLKGFIREDFAYPFYLEQGVGLLYLNDRTLSDVNLWEPGAGFTALIGYDFRKIGAEGFSMALGADYGLSFTQTTANYFLFFLQTQYYF
jgi:hypothetical protein